MATDIYCLTKQERQRRTLNYEMEQGRLRRVIGAIASLYDDCRSAQRLIQERVFQMYSFFDKEGTSETDVLRMIRKTLETLLDEHTVMHQRRCRHGICHPVYILEFDLDQEIHRPESSLYANQPGCRWVEPMPNLAEIERNLFLGYMETESVKRTENKTLKD